MKMKKIGIIGRVADGTELLDGQTVKTKILCEELKKIFPDREVICVDTYQYKRRVLPILFDTLKVFKSCEDIFILLSKNGRRFFFPILNGINFFCHRRLYHDAVGGALAEEAAERLALRKQLRRFEINWVEFSAMKERLEELKIYNVEVLPNFKRLNVLAPDQISEIKTEPFVFTMFSRIIKEKGIETAAKAIREVNSRFGRKRAVLHIYGPVDNTYRKEFEMLLKEYQNCVPYGGCIPYQDSVKALSSSYMLLFPSVYRGEGMPGTIIDAFSAGLPVIASDWHFNQELVREGETGYCYKWQNPEMLVDKIIYAVDHPEKINQMRKVCLEEALKYTPEKAMEQIRGRIERKKGKCS